MKAKLIKLGTDEYQLSFPEGTNYIDGKLSLKNCQAIENGYDLDELAYNECQSWVYFATAQGGFIKGFQKAFEILGDKKFSIKEVVELSKILISNPIEKCGKTYQELADDYIQSLQQTEWGVEIEIEKYGHCEGCQRADLWHCAHADSCGNAVDLERPKLDSEGCLILKRKSN